MNVSGISSLFFGKKSAATIRWLALFLFLFLGKTATGQACPFVVVFAVETACPLRFDGSVTAIPSGGTAPYSFDWGIDTVHTSYLTQLDLGTYTVTITDANGCAVVDSVQLLAAQRPTVSSEATPATCFGDNDGTVTFITDDPNLLFYLLEPTPSNQTFYDSLYHGGYEYRILDTFGCVWRQYFNIDSPDKIIIDLPASVMTEMCDSTTLEPSFNIEPASYAWSPADFLSCTDCATPIANPFANTTYQLTVADSNGCSATDSIRVRVGFDRQAHIPNAFSPNDDGMNDVFHILGGCVEEVRLLRIFDRWGEAVFEANNIPANDPQYGWDGKFQGKDAVADVFVYHIIVTLRDGTELSYKGDLTLLR
ncbi:MAG: gliding motility-associated C-terminal domain-containing protein [Saprospiraceae bacterium]|nr:gliding motility-associated C-terminal domain-containing protein [Saprospiraceae bacterium]